MTVTMRPLAPEDRGACPEEFGFGTHFSDHMFVQHHHADKGWYDAVIEPYHQLNLFAVACRVLQHAYAHSESVG